MKKFLTGLFASIVCLACVVMASCAPMNIDKAEEKMEDAGYTVVAYEGEKEEGLVGGIVATKMESLLDIETLTALYFSSMGEAKDYYDDLDNDDAKWEGKWVFWGTEDAMEEFTKLF